MCNLDTSTPTNYQVSFASSDKQLYGFDQPDNIAPAGNYNTATIGGSQVTIPWKSVETGTIDKLTATITGTPADSIFFSRESSQTVMKAKAEKDNQLQILLTGDGDQTEDQLYAWYRQITSDTKIR